MKGKSTLSFVRLAVALVVVLIAFALPATALDGDTFTVNCAPLTIQRSDPIVFPNQPGAHVHSVIGGNAFQRNMPGTYDAYNANATTCDKSIDHSNYWVPHLYHYRTDKRYEMVKWNGAAVYYQKRACNYSPTAQYCDKSFVPLAFPYGFRMVAGDPFRRTQNNSNFADKAVSMMCIYDGGSIEGNGFPTRRCNLMRAQVYFPSCWDGKNIDTPNHKDHVAYPEKGDYNGGVCPQSHPVAIMSIFYEFFFDTSSYPETNRFAFANGDSTGYGYHGDFIMGWTNRDLLQTAHADCVTSANCPKLGNKAQSTEKLIYPAVYEEDLGLNGQPINSLPGNNTIVWRDTPSRIQIQ